MYSRVELALSTTPGGDPRYFRGCSPAWSDPIGSAVAGIAAAGAGGGAEVEGGGHAAQGVAVLAAARGGGGDGGHHGAPAGIAAAGGAQVVGRAGEQRPRPRRE